MRAHWAATGCAAWVVSTAWLPCSFYDHAERPAAQQQQNPPCGLQKSRLTPFLPLPPPGNEVGFRVLPIGLLCPSVFRGTLNCGHFVLFWDASVLMTLTCMQACIWITRSFVHHL